MKDNFPMKGLFLLISPKIKGAINFIKRSENSGRKKTFFMIFMGALFWILIFIISVKVLFYFKSIDVIGDLLINKLLSMILLTFFALLIFSNIITSLSNMFLSRDLELCHSLPVSLEEIFFSRMFFTIIDSSWMVIVFGLPIILAYGWVYRPGAIFYVELLHMGLAFLIICAGAGIFITMILAMVFPAHRTRDITILLSIVLLISLYIIFRIMRPERMVDPDSYFNLMHYMGALERTDSPYMPTHWISKSLWDHLIKGKSGFHLLESGLLWSTALSLIVINTWIAQAIYFTGYSRSQEAKTRRLGANKIFNFIYHTALRFFDPIKASIVDKEIRCFFRDNTQWSQLFLLGGLVVVYVYNFSVLPLEKSPIPLEFIQNQIAYLNMGLAGFVLSAISVRFIFPAVSSEGRAFWIILSSPVSLKRFLWTKYLLFLPFMIVLGEFLIIYTDYLLNVTPFMMLVSSITMFLLILVIVSMAVGLGGVYPRFRYENIAQVSTGFGGLVYMISSVGFIALIILIESWPVYRLFLYLYRGRAINHMEWVMIFLLFFIVIVLCTVGVIKSMNMGLKALRELE